MAPHYSNLLKAALIAITALQATATSRRHALRAPSLQSQLGKLPDLPPLGGVSGMAAAINNIPGAAAFFTGEQAIERFRAGAPAPAPLANQGDIFAGSCADGLPPPCSMRGPLAPGVGPPPGMPPPGLPAPVASAGVLSPKAVNDPSSFFSRVTNLLTCKALEDEVEKVCGSTPLFQAIHQFGNDLAMCTAAMGKIAELSPLFAEYFGAGATCSTKMDGWKFEGFKSVEKCQEQTRRVEFKTRCKLT